MKRRFLPPFALLPLLPLLATAAPPAVTLAVEWRWVDSALAPAAQAGVRDGAVVVGTAGAVSPRGAVVTSSAPPAAPAIQRLTVLNGAPARLRLETREPLQWVEAAVEPASPRPRIHARLRQAERVAVQAIELTPTWPGGRAPVRMAFRVEQGGGEFASTALLALDHWQAVAQAVAAAPAEPGTLRSGDATGAMQRELQLRVSVQP